MRNNNLVEHFIYYSSLDDQTLQDVIDEVNEGLGSHYGANRLSEWRHGKRSVPDGVRVFMLRSSLHLILQWHGIEVDDYSDAYINQLVDGITPFYNREK